MSKYKILITNDDGISSPGLEAAINASKELGSVTIAAPSSQQTGSSRSLAGNRNVALAVHKYPTDNKEIPAYHCDCSPALIVRHCLKTVFANKLPDLVISGINYGENLGINASGSGTVGAALEAASFGIPVIAISKQTDLKSHMEFTNQDWTAAAHFLNYFSTILLDGKMPENVDVFKIDVPYNATSKTKWKITELSRKIYYEKSYDIPSVKSKISDMKTNVIHKQHIKDKNSDIYAIVRDKVVSVTPLSLNFTSRVNLDDLQSDIISKSKIVNDTFLR